MNIVYVAYNHVLYNILYNNTIFTVLLYIIVLIVNKTSKTRSQWTM